MNARRVTWLLVAGVAVIAFAIWLSSQRHLERATLAGDPVLPGLERGVNTVTSVALHKGDATHVTLEKQPTQWLVAERGWPAARGKVRKLLLDLGALSVVEEKTRVRPTTRSWAWRTWQRPRPPAPCVSVVSPAQKWALILGKPSGAKSGYVRIPGTDRSLLAAPLVAAEADPKAWLDRAVLDVPLERMREIEAHGADGTTYTATRQKADDAHFSIATLPKGRELSSPAAADALGTALSAVTLDDVARAGGTTGSAGAAHRVPHLRRAGDRGRGSQGGRASLLSSRPLHHPCQRPGSPGAQRPPVGVGVRGPRLPVRRDLRAGRGTAEACSEPAA